MALQNGGDGDKKLFSYMLGLTVLLRLGILYFHINFEFPIENFN